MAVVGPLICPQCGCRCYMLGPPREPVWPCAACSSEKAPPRQADDLAEQGAG